MFTVSNLLSETASPEVIAALIALAGVLISLIINCSLGWATRKYNYNQLFAQTVSSNRMEWINVWRENISMFLASAKVLRVYCKCSSETEKIEKENYRLMSSLPCEEFDEYVFKMEKSRSMITTRLNFNEQLHRDMYAAIKCLDYLTTDESEFENRCKAIEEIARQILKPEWERVKKEAKGERR